ncbi:hypothetical protein ACNOYE_10000 [Nannocystaceae bacterium ST9]
MSEFKLPPPRRLLRCDVLHHDDALVGRDVHVFEEVAQIEPSHDQHDQHAAPDLLLVVDELVDELSIALTLIEDELTLMDREQVAEVA